MYLWEWAQGLRILVPPMNAHQRTATAGEALSSQTEGVFSGGCQPALSLAGTPVLV